MCTTCGCASGNTRIEGSDLHHDHSHDLDHSAGHSHDPGHAHAHLHSHQPSPQQDAVANLHFGKGPAGNPVPGLSQSRMVQIEEDILGKNNGYAAQNRALFVEHNLLVLNLVSSPGSGKTSLLTHSIDAIKDKLCCGVIEGDQQTANDADRIRATGVQAVQINTGKGCHLDAHMVGHALEQFDLQRHQVLFIENVGNLVCPAAFDLGEAHKVVILSVTEGEDKPLKYPDMFHAADLMILNKTDLLPYLDFDIEQCIDYARRVNPQIEVIQLSAKSGEGMQQWYAWIDSKRQALLQVEDAAESRPRSSADCCSANG